MSQSATPPIRISSQDRLGASLLLAAALHAIVILGVGFEAHQTKQPPMERTLEVTLVHSRDDNEPEKADFLAQANQRGGGNVTEKVRPASPYPNPRPTPEKGTAARTQEAAAPAPKQQSPRTVLSTERPSSRKAPVVDDAPTPDTELPRADQLMERSLEIARLSAEIRRSQEAYAQMPRHDYVTANTREHVTAAYEEAWRLKVERVGNLNYPDEAKRGRLAGTLLLDVAIRADGTLHSTKVVRSSGVQVLDDAAVRIVQMAAPFAPFPETLREKTDILHIIRAWQFETDNSLSTHR